MARVRDDDRGVAERGGRGADEAERVHAGDARVAAVPVEGVGAAGGEQRRRVRHAGRGRVRLPREHEQSRRELDGVQELYVLLAACHKLESVTNKE